MTLYLTDLALTIIVLGEVVDSLTEQCETRVIVAVELARAYQEIFAI